MKNYTLTLVLLFFSFSFFGSQKSIIKIDHKYESTVVINIKKHTNEEILTSQNLLLKINTLVIDYKCFASGVIVFKLSHNFVHESDIKHLVIKSLSSKIPVNRIGIIFVDIHSKINQC
jgi:hypothetical protein